MNFKNMGQIIMTLGEQKTPCYQVSGNSSDAPGGVNVLQIIRAHYRNRMLQKHNLGMRGVCSSLVFYQLLLAKINLPLFSTVLPSNSRLFLSCRPFVVITTLSTGLVDVKVTSVSWLGQLTVGV